MRVGGIPVDPRLFVKSPTTGARHKSFSNVKKPPRGIAVHSSQAGTSRSCTCS
jgi:hypothetical protein